jgi:hypothetical protein
VLLVIDRGARLVGVGWAGVGYLSHPSRMALTRVDPILKLDIGIFGEVVTNGVKGTNQQRTLQPTHGDAES